MSNSINRAFDIIRLLRRSTTPLSLTDVSRSIGIAPSSAHGILVTLRKQGAITIDGDKRYRLGPAIFYLGASYARQSPGYRAVWSELLEVADEFGLSATVAVPWEAHHLILAVHQNNGPKLGIGTGSRVPLDGGSYGKAYFAWSGASLPLKITKFTDRTITDKGKYAEELDQTRHQGYATDDQEFVVDVAAVAVGVTSDAGYEGLAALTGESRLMQELTFARVGRRLAEIGAKASVVLGDPIREHLWGES